MAKITRTSDLSGVPAVLRSYLENFIWGVMDGVPEDGVTGIYAANKGASALDRLTGTVYRNVGSKSSPSWLPSGSIAGKLIDGESLRFGDGTDTYDETVSDRRFYYEAAPDANTGGQLILDCVADSTTTNYGTGLKVTGDDMFTSVGAKKRWLVAINGGRASAVMGGDANDMLLKLDYDNEAVCTPTGAYARGLSVQVNNKTTGVIAALQGAYIGARQRSTGAVGSLEGLQIDVKIDSGKTAATDEIRGLAVELNLCANSPAASYGVVVRNLTDGNYTEPTAAFKAINDGTSACEGFDYGLDLMSAAGVATVRLGEIRLSAQDANNLPCVIFAGAGTDDATIVTDIGADTLWADGSIYISVVDGAGTLWQKRNDTWTSI